MELGGCGVIGSQTSIPIPRGVDPAQFIIGHDELCEAPNEIRRTSLSAFGRAAEGRWPLRYSSQRVVRNHYNAGLHF